MKRVEYYIIDTLAIEYYRLIQEERTEIHYSKPNENNQVVKDRHEKINALALAINFLENLAKHKRYWSEYNQFDDNNNYNPFKNIPYTGI